MPNFDAVVVGGGPAGSAAARVLVDGGLRVAVLDRATFPRVKLCAGWLSVPVWDVLERNPENYPGSLWPWERCHVQFGGRRHTVRARGYFIRRYEFDDWLLGESGAEVIQHSVRSVERDGADWIIDGQYRARFLIGAGGTHCPVARALFGKKPKRPVGVQELEFEAGADQVAATRVGYDGEPELLLHEDLRGYSWNIPKSEWLNVGCGTLAAGEVREAWARARDFFQGQEHLPKVAETALDKAKGHSYYLFHPGHLVDCERDGAVLVGDSLGLAQPLTAEGILPAILSGRLAAEAILDGEPHTFAPRMKAHPVIADYTLLFKIREAGASLRKPSNGGGRGRVRVRPPQRLVQLSHSAVAAGFAWMFSGRPLPGRPLVRMLGR